MPVSMSEYATPRWVKMRTRYPIVPQTNYRYQQLTVNPRLHGPRHQMDPTGRVTVDGWKLPGYNPNHDSIKPETFNVGTDTSQRSFRPY